MGRSFNPTHSTSAHWLEWINVQGLKSASLGDVQPKAEKPQAPRKSGSTVEHPKYGRGVIVRREGEGEDAKLTVSFPGYGLKKLVEKYAGLKRD